MTDNAILTALIENFGEDLVFRTKKLMDNARTYGVKIATAESLTAGGIGHLLQHFDPDKEVLVRSNTVYTNAAKMDLLDVNKQTLDDYDAVSAPVAKEMAEGALKRSDAQISVAVTGYAGPGGNDAKEIDGGTVFIHFHQI